jgi:hypothetical protein
MLEYALTPSINDFKIKELIKKYPHQGHTDRSHLEYIERAKQI